MMTHFFNESSVYYPKILVVALGKINKVDLNNNGLLLRNLFKSYPSENIAQIYSSGSNKDEGFFKYYYCLTKEDRRFGSIFYLLKNEDRIEPIYDKEFNDIQFAKSGIKQKIKSLFFNLFVKTGLYELIFKVRISKKMKDWIKEFKPDIILAQGYNLSFSLLPILIKKSFNIKLAFLTTDDWPKYLYNGKLGESKLLSSLARRRIKKVSSELIKLTDIPFAFGYSMAKEYENRYGKYFNVISHSDDPQRFENSTSKRLNPINIFNIIAIGSFNSYRWPLLLDLDEACDKLNKQGLQVRLSVMSSAIEPEGLKRLKETKNIDLYADPGNDALPCFLKGADLLFLPEGFDEKFVEAIRLSISSKSHLFMFSKKPILIYSHKNTGIAKYANDFGWAKVLSERSIFKLTEVIKELISNKEATNNQIIIAYNLAFEKHNNNNVSNFFRQLLVNSLM